MSEEDRIRKSSTDWGEMDVIFVVFQPALRIP